MQPPSREGCRGGAPPLQRCILSFGDDGASLSDESCRNWYREQIRPSGPEMPRCQPAGPGRRRSRRLPGSVARSPGRGGSGQLSSDRDASSPKERVAPDGGGFSRRLPRPPLGDENQGPLGPGSSQWRRQRARYVPAVRRLLGGSSQHAMCWLSTDYLFWTPWASALK